jgi:hypothetical protein
MSKLREFLDLAKRKVDLQARHEKVELDYKSARQELDKDRKRLQADEDGLRRGLLASVKERTVFPSGDHAVVIDPQGKRIEVLPSLKEVPGAGS